MPYCYCFFAMKTNSMIALPGRYTVKEPLSLWGNCHWNHNEYIWHNTEIDAFVSLSCLDIIFVRLIALIESNHDECIPLWLSVWVRVNDFYQLPFSIQSFMASLHFRFIRVHLCVYHLPLYVARSRHHLPCLMFNIAWIVIVESSQNGKTQ